MLRVVVVVGIVLFGVAAVICAAYGPEGMPFGRDFPRGARVARWLAVIFGIVTVVLIIVFVGMVWPS